MTAAGTWRSKKGLPPAASMAAMRALTTGSVGDGEGEAVDDDAGELLALDVDALPEGGGAEEDGVGGVAELLEQDVAGGRAVEE